MGGRDCHYVLHYPGYDWIGFPRPTTTTGGETTRTRLDGFTAAVAYKAKQRVVERRLGQSAEACGNRERRRDAGSGRGHSRRTRRRQDFRATISRRVVGGVRCDR